MKVKLGRPITKILAGARYGRLTVTREARRGSPTRPRGQRHRRIICRCDCGTERAYWLSNLTTGRSAQCKRCGYDALRKTERDAAIVVAFRLGESIDALAEKYEIASATVVGIIPATLRRKAWPEIPIGARFGSWRVVGKYRIKRFSTTTARSYPCRCDCGTKREVLALSLRSGSSLSCGCQRGCGNWPHGRGPHPELEERDALIVKRVKSGETPSEVARSLGMTRQRVHQILRGE